jgi:hypothetical protein
MPLQPSWAKSIAQSVRNTDTLLATLVAGERPVGDLRLLTTFPRARRLDVGTFPLGRTELAKKGRFYERN